jgi:hypothetical protein
MKRYFVIGLLVLFASFCLTSMGLGAFDVPTGVYRIDQMEQATKDAASHNKQIVFLYSDEKTTCPLCARASTAIMDKFKLNSVIVYFDKGGWQKVPQIVREAINSPASGKYIPKTIVVNASMTEVVSIIPYETVRK